MIDADVYRSPRKRGKFEGEDTGFSQSTALAQTTCTNITLLQPELSLCNLECNETIGPSSDNAAVPSNKEFCPPFDVEYLSHRDQQMSINPSYINLHPELTKEMRPILFDWMMEIAAEMHLTRQTFHLATSYVDLYLSKSSNTARGKLQSLGTVALWIAAKFEEIYPPKVTHFAKFTEYSVTSFKEAERKLLTALDWELAIPTVSLWTNIFIGQWDEFMKAKVTHLPTFKEQSKESYMRYRGLMQILDAAMLDTAILSYTRKQVALAGMYVILSDSAISSDPNEAKALKACFEQCFGIRLEDYEATVQYMSTYMKMPFTYKRPKVPAGRSEVVLLESS